MSAKYLNIGCGKRRFDGPEWVNLDKEPGIGDVTFDLNTCGQLVPLNYVESGVNQQAIPTTKLVVSRMPFPDNTFERIFASHILEHIPNILPLMQELWRVAKPDCSLVARVPYGSSDNAFEDPTHVRQYFMQSFSYYGQLAYNAADYGYRGDWEEVQRVIILKDGIDAKQPAEDLQCLIMQARNVVDEFIVEMKATKPIRVATGQEHIVVPCYIKSRTADA